MNLLPLVDLIEESGLATPRKDLFLQMMPPEAENAVLLRPPLPGTKIDHELDGYFHAEFQVIVRSHGYVQGLEKMQELMALLAFGEREVGPQTFKYCRPRTLPVAFPLSKGNLVEYNVMFDCCYVELP